MLVRKDGEGALVIGQLSHAWLSGQLARAWGSDEFPMPEPREDIALGAEQHDVGWALFDLRPRLSEDTGLPRSFLELTVEEHLEIWESAPDRLLSASPHAALVVSMHGASLSELRLAGGRGGGQELQRHIDAERDRQMRLRAMLGLGEHEAALIRRLMWTWDGLSLALCNGWDPFTARDVPARDEQLRDLELRGVPGDGILELEPWPFSRERVELRCAARRLAAPYEDEAEMQRALQEAEHVTLQFTLVSRTTTV